MVLLESRLDNVVFRLGLARTRREARQIVDHKHILRKRQAGQHSVIPCKGRRCYRNQRESTKVLQRYKEILEVTEDVWFRIGLRRMQRT